MDYHDYGRDCQHGQCDTLKIGIVFSADESNCLLRLIARQFRCSCQTAVHTCRDSQYEHGHGCLFIFLQPGEQNVMHLRLIAAGIKESDMTCSSKLKRQKKREHPQTLSSHVIQTLVTC
ncbi:hypothetical protein CAPTEDRAFT_214549 [Capitella teleta]|uniref:Uncharacterized protein n=1 Tax=Capitella teleta TaxID=283909 RepID=R7TWC9_CAPTE|nr:hypothetical protein CAPTEDRAFT_214549 [Capitella teleta]|eukprot:ELT95746.1 hypothetical protein CAPTEDRAFT_214549 [Capitella teleta]